MERALSDTIETRDKPVPANTLDMGNPRPGVIPLFVHEQVLEEILDYSEQDIHRELGGFLLGGIYRDADTVYLEVEHFLPAIETESNIASLTFTHETWSALHRQVEMDHPDAQILGWHHTHPDFGIFLSAHDRFIHRNFFSATWQVAMVVDPKRREFGFYQWREGDIVDSGFKCVCSDDPAG